MKHSMSATHMRGKNEFDTYNFFSFQFEIKILVPVSMLYEKFDGTFDVLTEYNLM